MPQPFYFFRFEFKRPVKLISPLVELERVRKLERSGWVAVGSGKGMLILNLKMEFFLIKTHSEPEIYRARTRVSCVNFNFTKSDVTADADVQLNQ